MAKPSRVAWHPGRVMRFLFENMSLNNYPSLKLTANAPENGPSQKETKTSSNRPFSGDFAVSLRVKTRRLVNDQAKTWGDYKLRSIYKTLFFLLVAPLGQG